MSDYHWPVDSHWHLSAEIIKTAVNHGAELVTDDCTDLDSSWGEIARDALDKHDLTREEIDVIAEVADIGAEYMSNCLYADDEDFPEDALADRELNGKAKDYVYQYFGVS